jgi:ABC-type sugar transport system permease subunit
MRELRLTMDQRRKLHGYIFVSPFILGTLIFFAFPLAVSIKLAFGHVTKLSGFIIEWIGVANFKQALILDINFLPMFYNLVLNTIRDIPLIIIFSLFISILINKSMKGRGLFRLIFFLPFLLGSGEVIQHMQNQGIHQQVLSIADGTLIPRELIVYLGKNATETIDLFFGTIVSVMWGSCVQILIFLSGLQSIPISLFEASKVEGATEWDTFWKVTLPMMMPVIFLNIIYTIVDLSITIENPLFQYIKYYAFHRMSFGYASAMGWLYFVFILLVILLIMSIFRRNLTETKIKRGNKK